MLNAIFRMLRGLVLAVAVITILMFVAKHLVPIVAPGMVKQKINEDVEIDWVQHISKSRLVMKIPRHCVQAVFYDPEANEMWGQYLTINKGPRFVYLSAERKTSSDGSEESVTCSTSPRPQKNRFSIKLSANFQEDFAFSLRRQEERMAEYALNKESGSYLAGTYAGLARYRDKVCDKGLRARRRSVDIYKKPLDGMYSQFSDDISPNGCIDSDLREKLFDTAAAADGPNYAFSCDRTQPEEMGWCRASDDFGGWQFEYSLSREELARRDQIRGAIIELLDSMVRNTSSKAQS
jgi:hypothetical protein